MTYRKMTKTIERTKECIEFMCKIQKTLSGDDLLLCADTINRLLAYKNYLIYEKEYTELSYNDLKSKNESDNDNITLTPYTDPKTIDLDYLLREPFGYNKIGDTYVPINKCLSTETDPKDIKTKMTNGGKNCD